jgi:multidrug efflux system membrane fusion protein
MTAAIRCHAKAKPRLGKLTFIDNAVERNTGTIAARATIENLDLSLLPGQYVRIRLHIRELPNALMVPHSAPASSANMSMSSAEQRVVALGPTDGDLLTSGIKEGDKIISGNLQKIFPGAAVQPLDGGGGSGAGWRVRGRCGGNGWVRAATWT